MFENVSETLAGWKPELTKFNFFNFFELTGLQINVRN